MELREWVKVARDSRYNNLLCCNYYFENLHGIVDASSLSLFEEWLVNIDDSDSASDALEEFAVTYGGVQLSGQAVDPSAHGEHVVCVKSWHAFRRISLHGVVLSRGPGGAEAIYCDIEQLLQNDMATLAKDDVAGRASLIDINARLDALTRNIKNLLADNKDNFSRISQPLPEPHADAGQPAYITVGQEYTAPDIRIPAHPTTVWIAPYNNIKHYLTESGPASKTSGNIIRLLGLKVDNRFDFDVRFILMFPASSISSGTVRRPTMFSGGFADLYASFSLPAETDNWGRTVFYDAAGVVTGVPEAVLSEHDLCSAIDGGLVGIVLRRDYMALQPPSTGDIATTRFAAGACY
ncbi:MAG: hypothetical protein WCJ64_12865 [Rhodospirillaceae bacterium]